MEKHPKSTPYRMKRSPLRNENDKLVITEKDGIQTRTKGNRTATYVINPDYDAKKGESATPKWIRKKQGKTLNQVINQK